MHRFSFSQLFEKREKVNTANEMFLSPYVTRMHRSGSGSFADLIRVDNFIINVVNICVNKQGIVFLVKGTRVADDTGHNFRERRVATPI